MPLAGRAARSSPWPQCRSAPDAPRRRPSRGPRTFGYRRPRDVARRRARRVPGGPVAARLRGRPGAQRGAASRGGGDEGPRAGRTRGRWRSSSPSAPAATARPRSPPGWPPVTRGSTSSRTPAAGPRPGSTRRSRARPATSSSASMRTASSRPGTSPGAVELLGRTDADNVGGVMLAQGRTPFERAVARAMRSTLGHRRRQLPRRRRGGRGRDGLPRRLPAHHPGPARGLRRALPPRAGLGAQPPHPARRRQGLVLPGAVGDLPPAFAMAGARAAVLPDGPVAPPGDPPVPRDREPALPGAPGGGRRDRAGTVAGVVGTVTGRAGCGWASPRPRCYVLGVAVGQPGRGEFRRQAGGGPARARLAAAGRRHHAPDLGCGVPLPLRTLGGHSTAVRRFEAKVGA